ncbi:MAG: DUF1697 domain-containing protein, partial [Pyrinomonadaceae bacterium]
NVKSYINSGNIAFDVSSPHVSKGHAADSELAAKIHDAIQKDFGFDISVMVRTAAEIQQVIANNPFEGQFENDKDVHVFFLNEELSEDQKALLHGQETETENYAVMGRHILSNLKISILDSAVGKGFIDKKLRIPATGRNWRTVKTIAEM